MRIVDSLMCMPEGLPKPWLLFDQRSAAQLPIFSPRESPVTQSGSAGGACGFQLFFQAGGECRLLLRFIRRAVHGNYRDCQNQKEHQNHCDSA
jgi:hypothetical protein